MRPPEMPISAVYVASAVAIVPPRMTASALTA
jgi:hypothetical protein